MTTRSKLTTLLAFATLTTACAGGEELGPEDGAPLVIGLSRTEVGVGERIDIIGGNFIGGQGRRTDLYFEGEYETEDGALHPVQLEVRPYWQDGNTLVWQHVGPYQIPFSPTGDELGTFRGTVSAINRDDDEGTEQWSQPAEIELSMKPSIIIRKFQPLNATCSEPAVLAIGGIPYEVTVEAVGFEPVNFSYVIAGEPGQPVPRIYRQEATGTIDEFGADGELNFELVPSENDSPFYPTIFAVSALGADGIERHTGVIIGIHNPIEVIPLPTFEVAEIEPAVPVSGCISGGDTSRTVTYSEQETDTRTRTQSINWNEQWYESISSQQGGSTTRTNGFSVTNARATQTGTVFTWNWMAEVETEVNIIPQIWSVGGSAGGGQSYANYNLTTNTRTVGTTYSESDTESWSYEQSRAYTLSEGGEDSYTVSSSQSTIVSFEGLILPQQFGVFYRQASRINLPALVVAYSTCGEAEVVGDATLTDYTWSVDLATGPTCPDFPESDLPEAQCFVPPCGNTGQSGGTE